jgi:hypothetical protein
MTYRSATAPPVPVGQMPVSGGSSTAEDMLVVPLEKLPVRSMRGGSRTFYAASVKRIVAPPVPVIVTQASAHFQSKIRRYGNVAGIEQTMKVCPEQQPISNLVGPVLRIRADMGGFQGRQRMLVCDRTATTVRVQYSDAERGLPEPRLNKPGLTVAGAALD